MTLLPRLAGARAEGRTRGEGARAHAEARAERRRNVAEKVAAARAVAVVGSGDGNISAHPLAASFALRIDALHGETGQELHVVSLRGRKARVNLRATTLRSRTKKLPSPLAADSRGALPPKEDLEYNIRLGRAGTMQAMARILPLDGCGVKRKDYKILW